MKKPTIYDIKAATEKTSPYYFDRKNMRSFGQTMRSFKVRISPKGRIFIVADMYSTNRRTGEKRFMGVSCREFTNGDTLSIIPHEAKDNIGAYIDAN